MQIQASEAIYPGKSTNSQASSQCKGGSLLISDVQRPKGFTRDQSQEMKNENGRPGKI
jgi:hypothetical protein